MAAPGNAVNPALATGAGALVARPRRRRSVLGVVLRQIRRLALLIVILLLWQYVSLYVLDKMTRSLLPPPTAVLTAAWDLLVSGDLVRNLRDSVRREFVAFLYALVAIPLGIAMGWWRWVEEQLDPVVEILRPVPPIAWIPLAILWFGIGDTQNEFIIFLGIFFPILLNTITGVKGVERNLIRAARCLGASEWAVLWRVALRAALPQIMTGVRVGLGVGWMALVAAELVGAISGPRLHDQRRPHGLAHRPGHRRHGHDRAGRAADRLAAAPADAATAAVVAHPDAGERRRRNFRTFPTRLMGTVKIHGVHKVYPSITGSGDDVVALEDVSFAVQDHEFCSILGHSGCGKTTLLNMLGGFEQPTAGRAARG